MSSGFRGGLLLAAKTLGGPSQGGDSPAGVIHRDAGLGCRMRTARTFQQELSLAA